MTKTFRKNVSRFMVALTASCALAAAMPVSTGMSDHAYAQGTATTIPGSIDAVGGTDNSSALGSVNNMASTIIHFLINVVARVVGVGLAIFAIFQFVKREIVWGVVNFCLCGVCFFLPNIITGIAAMGG